MMLIIKLNNCFNSHTSICYVIRTVRKTIKLADLQYELITIFISTIGLWISLKLFNISKVSEQIFINNKNNTYFILTYSYYVTIMKECLFKANKTKTLCP